MPALRLFFLLLFVAACSPAWAEDTPSTATAPASAPPDTTAEQHFPEMIFSHSAAENADMDIDPARFADFWKNWHFVAVRWRQDARQFRFAYANDLAWKTLSEHRTDYPDGAMFGKLVYPAEEDLSLPNSVLASNRLDLLEVMLWDPHNPKAAPDGWVYLRFINPDLRITETGTGGGRGNMSQKEIATCIECHSRAYDRADVFSQPQLLFRDPHAQAQTQVDVTTVLSDRFAQSMKDVAPNAAPPIANDLIRTMSEWKDRKIKGYEGDFSTGTLNAMIPVLAKLAEQDTASVYMVYDRDDPNTIELASSVQRKGHDHCVGLVNMRGSMQNAIPHKLERLNRNLKVPDDAIHQPNAAQGANVQDASMDFKPSVDLYIICGTDGVSRQNLPLLYKAEDKDGLPSYSFAPYVAE